MSVTIRLRGCEFPIHLVDQCSIIRPIRANSARSVNHGNQNSVLTCVAEAGGETQSFWKLEAGLMRLFQSPRSQLFLKRHQALHPVIHSDHDLSRLSITTPFSIDANRTLSEPVRQAHHKNIARDLSRKDSGRI